MALSTDEKWARLEKACQLARLTLNDLVNDCRTGNSQMHDVDDAIGVTSIEVSGLHKVCYISVVGGTLAGLAELSGVIETFARVHGCQAIRTMGRTGFENVFQDLAEGFVPIGTVYEKVL